MTDEQSVVIATDLSEIDPQKIMLSPVMTYKWSYKNKETNEMCNGSYPYVHVYYEKPKQTLCVLMTDVRTNNGIQTATKYPSLFMSNSLTEEQSKMLREKIDDRIAELLFEVRQQFLKGYPSLSKLKQPSDLGLLMRPLVTEGQLKGDGSDDKYNDQITTTVPSKKQNKQVVVNTDACTIEDINGKPYAWAGMGATTLKEMAFSISKICYNDQIKYTTEARIIVPTETSREKVTTKRKLELTKELKESKAKKQATASKAKPNAKVMQSRTKPAVSAFNSKLNKPIDENSVEEEQHEGSEGSDKETVEE
jgi:hypothetical protein